MPLASVFVYHHLVTWGEMMGGRFVIRRRHNDDRGGFPGFKGRGVGVAAIGLAIGFNLPYGLLAANFDYPAILRAPAVHVLQRFAEGGAGLLFSWYGFMLSALLFSALAPGLTVTPRRLRRHPALTVGAAMCGGLAGLAQAIGLARWVFVVPGLARTATDPSAQSAFDLLNAWGGVAIGEHIGQMLTALFVLQVAILQHEEGCLPASLAGCATAGLLAVGTCDVLMAGSENTLFADFTVVGFLALTVWLIVTGLDLIRAQQRSR